MITIATAPTTTRTMMIICVVLEIAVTGAAVAGGSMLEAEITPAALPDGEDRTD
jgi:hypothetical protein